MNIKTIEADITTLKVDAIVNAANERMLGGGGVDGAIHRAAGPGLYKACLALPEIEPGIRCRTGGVKFTPAFNLPCKYIIHAVGPRWISRGNVSEHNEIEDLEACYIEALAVACALDLISIAFPAISTGIFSFPIGLACETALKAIRKWSDENQNGSVKEILLVTYMSPEVSDKYKELGL
jgi:O-acetyl-ADP-ribose deacetylase (regulator of RNase III)